MAEFNGDFKSYRYLDTLTYSELMRYRDEDRKRLFPDEKDEEE